MELYIQLQVLIVSFAYGLIIAYLLKVQHKFIFESKYIYKIIITTLFIFDNYLLYFIILRAINNGIFHIYFLLILLCGFSLGNYILKKKKY